MGRVIQEAGRISVSRNVLLSITRTKMLETQGLWSKELPPAHTCTSTVTMASGFLFGDLSCSFITIHKETRSTKAWAMCLISNGRREGEGAGVFLPCLLPFLLAVFLVSVHIYSHAMLMGTQRGSTALYF